MGRLMTDARSLHCKEEGVVGKSDVGEGKITSSGVLWEVPYSHHHRLDL